MREEKSKKVRFMFVTSKFLFSKVTTMELPDFAMYKFLV